ncbi:MAG: acyltransferase, partial [Zoogloeaceae bacterium]|nr:acyltransferase [Zoogloeaceae bacterium]
MSASTAVSRHWADIGEAGFLGGMRLLFWIYRHLGASPFRLALTLVMLWFFATRRLARNASREYLARLHAASGGTTPAPTWRNVFRHFMAFGEVLLDKLRVSDPRQRFTPPWQAEGLEQVKQLLDARRGALIITAHFGNLEICRHLADQVDTRIALTILVHTRHAERFNRLLQKLNPTQETDLIQVDSLDAGIAMRISERIAAGGFVVIAGDRVPLSGQDTQTTPFIGAAAAFPVGPYLLAAALDCPVLTMFSA